MTVADRDFVESQIDAVLERALVDEIALLVVGDPFGATTHCDVLKRARELGVRLNVVHNASIMNAIGCCGLQLYRLGETISIPTFTSGWRPASFVPKMLANRNSGAHTLALLDIKASPNISPPAPIPHPPSQGCNQGKAKKHLTRSTSVNSSAAGEGANSAIACAWQARVSAAALHERPHGGTPSISHAQPPYFVPRWRRLQPWQLPFPRPQVGGTADRCHLRSAVLLGPRRFRI